MRRRTVTTLVALVIATLFLCPVSEMFDHWDHTAKTGKDTESSLMLVAECAGAAIAVLHVAPSSWPGLVTAGPATVFHPAEPRLISFAPERNRFPESPPALPLRI